MLFKDQMGFSLALDKIPQRIVSLVPSQTEYLCSLGLEKKIVGITKFCVHPASCYSSKVRVGGTKNFDLEMIKLLNPDLIIANKEENTESLIIQLRRFYPVWISDIHTLDDACEMMLHLGDIFHQSDKATEIVTDIVQQFSALKTLEKPQTAAYFIWRKPYMSVNKNTFIHDMLSRCGFQNVFADFEKDYPEVLAEEIHLVQPDVILLSSEPYPFKEKHIAELKEISPKSKIVLVDGEMFSWYGSRMLQSVPYFHQLQHQLF